MLKKNNNLIQLKHALLSMHRTHQGMAATLGLLASSDLNPIQKIPDLCLLLQQFFKLTSCGFFWADEAGNMQDAWCLAPDLLSYNTLTSCQAYQASGTRAWPTFRENMLKGAVAGYLLPFQNERFYASNHYQSTYQAINVRHILDVVLHDGTRAFGAFLMMRSVEQGPFTPDERSLLVKLIPILNEAFFISSSSDIEYSERETIGFALLSQDGKYKSLSEEARRIVWTLTHCRVGSFADPNDPSIEQHLEGLVAQYAPRIQFGEKFVIEIQNRWGKFTLAFEQESKLRDTIVTLRRRIPLSSQLAFYLARLNLPPARQMVAWLLAENHSRKEIATNLGISVETVTSHIKAIYKAVGTCSSHGLFLKLGG